MLLMAIDGACKRNGKPDCLAVGAVWIQHNDKYLYEILHETNSTSQRGEIKGLIAALTYASRYARDEESVVIVTDSEYLHNTVVLEWCFKWRTNKWTLASGEPAKNVDLWTTVCDLLDDIGYDKVFLNWTKGHLLSYAPRLIKQSLDEDITGIALYSNLTTIANRPSERTRIADDFNYNRRKNEYSALPAANAIEMAVVNVMADCIAGYSVKALDDIIITSLTHK